MLQIKQIIPICTHEKTYVKTKIHIYEHNYHL